MISRYQWLCAVCPLQVWGRCIVWVAIFHLLAPGSEVLSALGVAVAAYLSLYPAMLLCPLLLLSYRVSPHHCSTWRAWLKIPTPSYPPFLPPPARWRAGQSGVPGSGWGVDSPPLPLLLPLHWLLGLPACHTQSHVSSGGDTLSLPLLPPLLPPLSPLHPLSILSLLPTPPSV